MRGSRQTTAARDLERFFRGRPPRRNRSRREDRQARLRRRGRLAAVLGAVAAAGFAAALGLLFVFLHDLLTRGDFFPARRIEVVGAVRLSAPEILQTAGVQRGMNLLGLNLSAARRRLLAHPWIREAELRREIPSRLDIRVREHTAIARVALGRGFLLNESGEIFKEADPADPADLPEVEGLTAEDLPVADRSEAQPATLRRGFGLLSPEERRPPGRALAAVMALLESAAAAGDVLPPPAILRVRVDRQLGLTVFLREGERRIDLGWDDYGRKLTRLAEVRDFFRAHPEMASYRRLDFTDPQRTLVGLEAPPQAARPQTHPGG